MLIGQNDNVFCQQIVFNEDDACCKIISPYNSSVNPTIKHREMGLSFWYQYKRTSKLMVNVS